MKKVLMTLLIVLMFVLTGCDFDTSSVSYNNKIKCVDGDTAWINDEKVRFIAIDAPEISNGIEPFGMEAKELACELLKEADSITLEFDLGNEMDRYDRKLYWIFVDGKLVQEELVAKGYARIKYVDYDTVNYQYLNRLKKAEKNAKHDQLGIWKKKH